MLQKLSLITLILLYGCVIIYAQVPTESDCLGAIPVCDDIYFELNSYTDEGNYENELHEDCCVENEQNSVWYRFVPTISGELGFEIIPNDLDDDYDWAVFNITNVGCEDLINNFDALVSCNATGGQDNGFTCYGVTGANGGTIYNFQNLNCGTFPPTMDSDGYLPFNELLPVQAGDVYVLLIVNFSGTDEGYTLDFTVGEDVGISDNISPEVSEFNAIFSGCEVNQLDFLISEPIFCSSLENTDITISGPGGPYSITLTSEDCDNLQFENDFSAFITPPLSINGQYIVSFNEDPFDPCSNSLIETSFTIDISNVDEQITVLDTTFCEDQTLILDASEHGATSYLWNDLSTASTLEISESGTYIATVDLDCRQIEKTYIIQISTLPEITDFQSADITCLQAGSIEILSVDGNNPFEYSLDGILYISSSQFPIMEPGDYSVFVRDIFGCETVQSFTINESTASVDVSLPPFYDISFGDTISISPEISGLYDTLYWTEDLTTLDCADCTDINVFPSFTTTYTIVLVDEMGCIVSVSTEVRVRSIYEYYAPNIFSPNNDGVNDNFTIFGGSQLESISLLVIYDRWGEKLFEGFDLEPGDLDSGWDGRFKDRPVMISVYTWMAKLKYRDGVEKLESGTITLTK